MAEATLKDVIEEIRAQGDFTRMGSHGSLSVAITELRGVKSAVQTLSENFQLAFNDLIESQRKTIEEGAETADQQRARDALTPKEDKDDKKDSKINMKGLLDSIKGLIPKKSPGMFALLFGGLAGALAFFPDWIKDNFITPLADVFKVLSGEEGKTTLGKITEKIKNALNWVSDNLGPEAAWVVGLAGLAAALNPITSLKLGANVVSGVGSLVKGLLTASTDLDEAVKKTPRGGWGRALAGIGRFAGPLAAIAIAAYGAKEALDYFRGQNIESETQKSTQALDAYKKAVAEGNDKLAKEIADEQMKRLDRLKDTTIGNIESIRGPITEILADAKKFAEQARTQAAADLKAQTNEQGDIARQENTGVVGAIADVVGIEQISKEAQEALNQSKKATDQAAQASFAQAKTAEEFKATLQTQIDKIMQDAVDKQLQGESRQLFIEENLENLRERFEQERKAFFQGRGRAEIGKSGELKQIGNEMFLGTEARKDSNFGKMLQLAKEKTYLDPTKDITPFESQAKMDATTEQLKTPPAVSGGANINNVSPVDSRTYNDNKQTIVNNDNTVKNYFGSRDAAMVGF